MNACMHPEFAHMTLNADTAADLMTRNPVSIHQNAYVKEAVALFVGKRLRAAPVIDHAGRTVGVLSVSDIIVHERQRMGIGMENVDTTRVADLMTPGLLAVSPTTPCAEVIDLFHRLKVHHLFVVDEADTLVGVISSLDVLLNLDP
jgi:CBS domain-containing membrane protein